ncbi:hypothetical protein HOY34_05475 [Xinfangfangia sp. D13-10-4-6]|uniref:hypothetical protein n=1 Tax=Pseudogemmobacter hezensis TaxID=2737662 RepID=UPI001556904C|nr:hypothetical protein [Pseudogemmobacter hezensis]NPD14653.1 hypothetical protein [Pseudogemmobacter hezensis]
MRQAVIKSFDLLVTVLAGLIVIVALIAGVAGMAKVGFFYGLAVIIGGILYAIVFAGGLYLLIGIHENSKRTADAVERLASR